MHQVEKISIIDQVIKQLENSILSGEYKIGSKLPSEMELCRDMGVGRSTVREAYRMLKAFGLIELRHGKGAFVKNNQHNTQETIREWFIEKKSELIDLMEVRMAIEPLAVRLAIKKGTSRQIERIVELHKLFKMASKNTNIIRLVELDENFHSAIVEASNNHLIIKIHMLITEFFKEYRTKAFAVPENVQNALFPHSRIVEAIQSKDEQLAIECINKHLHISLEDIERVVKKK